MKKNKRIIFNLPGETITAEVIKTILENNGLKENPENYFEKLKNSEETFLTIIRDASWAMVEKKIPENNLAELLVKHLKTSNEIAAKIISDIKKELIPYAEIIDIPTNNTEEEKDDFQEKLLDKIKIGVSQQKPTANLETPMPYDKKPQITDVEKNAENMNTAGQNITTKEKEELPKENKNPPTQDIKPDTYREPVE